MTSGKKRLHIDPSGAGAYTFRDKIKPFLAGLLEGTPLVEVAVEGLRRGVDAERRKEYEIRIATHGSTEQIHAAMLSGLEPDTQDLMAVTFQQRYKLTLIEYSKKVESSESGMQGYNLVREGEKYLKSTMEQAVRLLRSGKVTSAQAQMDLASMIYTDGSEAQAREALAGGKITATYARHILRFKCGEHNGYQA
jgi:hypothetical protein